MSNPSETAVLHGRSRRGGRIALVVVAVLAVLIAVLTGGAYAYAKQYDGKALPGTTVLGQDVSGQSAEQIAAMIQKRADGVKVSVNVDGQQREVTLADLGVTVDAKGTAQKAAAHDGDLTEVARSTFSGERTIAPTVSVDEKTVASFASSLIPDEQSRATDSQVVKDEDGDWSIVSGHSGKSVDPASLVEALRSKSPALQSFTVDQAVQDSAPAIDDADANAALERIDATRQQRIVVTGPQNVTHEVSEKTINSWIVVAPNAAGDALDVTVDPAQVHEWVAGRAEKDSVKPTDGIEQVDAAGTTVKTIAQKKDGVQIANVDAVADQIVQSLNAGTPLEAAFDAQPLPAKVTKAKAPDAGQTDKQDPAATDSSKLTGEKWIDVNLTDKTLTAYIGDTPVFGPRKVVDGKPGYETVTGTFHIYQRYDSQDMTNAGKVDEKDPRYYYTEDVPWVQYFQGGYAIHGAPWRSSFGFSGSHGCINMSVKDAKWVYDFASEGTRVEVHY